MKNLKNSIVVLTVAFLVGCASPSNTKNMIYKGDTASYSQALQANVSVNDVEGGKETNPLLTSQIDNESFTEALVQSLVNQGLYSQEGRYELSAELIKLKQPIWGGFSMTVRVEVRYQVIDIDRQAVVFDELVSESYTARLGSSLSGVKRLRLANEGAVRKTIEALLAKLGEFEIEPMKLTMI